MAKKAKPAAKKAATKAAPKKAAPVKAAKAATEPKTKAVPAKAAKVDMSESVAIAPAGSVSTTSGAPKNFRNHPDIENFYRFIYENDLREEGLEILNAVLLKKAERRAAKKAGITLPDDDAPLATDASAAHTL